MLSRAGNFLHIWLLRSFGRCCALRLACLPIQLNCEPWAQVDPFVDMSVRDGRSQCTKTIWNNKDPVFNQVLSFIVNDPEHQSITAMVKDDDMQAFSKVCLRAGHNQIITCGAPGTSALKTG